MVEKEISTPYLSICQNDLSNNSSRIDLESTTEMRSDRLEGRKMATGEGKFLSHFYPTQRAKKRQNRENRILKNEIDQRLRIALLTIYDMCKAADRGMRIDGIRLLRKEGGKSGIWTAEA